MSGLTERDIVALTGSLVPLARAAVAERDAHLLDESLAQIFDADPQLVVLVLRQLLIDYAQLGGYCVPKLMELTGMTAEQIAADAKAKATRHG